MNCQFQGAGDPCWATIEKDPKSYSGYRHLEGDDTHWASPEVYGHGRVETLKIMLPCVVCGKLGGENSEHIERTGHEFRAQYKEE